MSPAKKNRYVICIKNQGYEVDLVLRKVYQVIPEPESEEHLMIRVVDETDEDYLYPASWFVPIKLPEAAEKLFPEVPQPVT